MLHFAFVSLTLFRRTRTVRHGGVVSRLSVQSAPLRIRSGDAIGLLDRVRLLATVCVDADTYLGPVTG